MLTELIDKIDCNPELMMTLAEQLGNLTDILQTPEQQVVLLQPLEVMVGNDDSIVREKATSSLMKIGKLLSTEYLKSQYLPLLKRQRKGDMFSMRISASCLYADIYQSLTQQDLKDMVLKKFTKLSKDDTPMVRRGAVISIPKISKYLTKSEAQEHLLPMVERLLKD